jgi:hypothetical protein
LADGAGAVGEDAGGRGVDAVGCAPVEEGGGDGGAASDGVVGEASSLVVAGAPGEQVCGAELAGVSDAGAAGEVAQDVAVALDGAWVRPAFREEPAEQEAELVGGAVRRCDEAKIVSLIS